MRGFVFQIIKGIFAALSLGVILPIRFDRGWGVVIFQTVLLLTSIGIYISALVEMEKDWKLKIKNRHK